MSSQLSIYIPHIHKDMTEVIIKNIMEYWRRGSGSWNIRVGKVARVDFSPIYSNGFHQESDDKSEFRAAYVYFINKDPHPMWARNDEYSPYSLHPIWECIEKGNPYHLLLPPDMEKYLKDTKYWTCLENKHPIQPTYMNIHQVVDNCITQKAILEQLIAQKADLENQLIAQKADLENQKADLENQLIAHSPKGGV